MRNQQVECDDSEGYLTDEEEVSCDFEGPPQITSWGPFVQEIECTPRKQPLISLNLNAPDLNSQHSLTSNQLSPDQSTHLKRKEMEAIHYSFHEESEAAPSDQQHDAVPQGPEEDTMSSKDTNHQVDIVDKNLNVK